MSPTATSEVYRGLLRGVEPEPDLLVSEWADARRMLSKKSSPHPGPWRTDRTPYLREIMDCLSPSNPVTEIVFMKAAQIGGTECGNNWIGYIIDLNPGPILGVQPSLSLARRLSRQRLAPMIEETPTLKGKVKEARERDSGNTLLSKEFNGGILVLIGSESAASLRQMAVRYLFLDEIDGYVSDSQGEGDPVGLAVQRTNNYKTRKKIFKASTPTRKGTSRIESEFEASDQRWYYVSCPHCKTMQVLRWSGIVWPKGEPWLAAYKCESCESLIQEFHKTDMLALGEWRAHSPGQGKPAGFHLSALYSPLGWKSWGDIAEEHQAAKGNPLKLKTWVNQVLAETWEEAGETIEDVAIMGRREAYGPEIPAAAAVLTVGVDIQNDRLEAELVAWGKEEESWSIDYRVFHGSPATSTVWNDLNVFLTGTFRHERGAILKVAATCIDTGGHHTQQAYRFCKTFKSNRVWACKGSSQPARPLVGRPSISNMARVKLFPVGTDTAKEAIYGRLKLEEFGPGFMHFPQKYEEEYFRQLTAEKMITKYTRGFPTQTWVKIRPRNEALDCRVLAYVALAILRPDLDRLVKSITEKRYAKDEEGRELATAKPVQEVTRRPRGKGGFVNRWRGR